MAGGGARPRRPLLATVAEDWARPWRREADAALACSHEETSDAALACSTSSSGATPPARDGAETGREEAVGSREGAEREESRRELLVGVGASERKEGRHASSSSAEERRSGKRAWGRSQGGGGGGCSLKEDGRESKIWGK